MVRRRLSRFVADSLRSAVDGLPLGAEWRAASSAERSEGERHLAVHEGHVTRVMERDREVLDRPARCSAGFGWVGDRDAVRAKADEAYAGGATEILYTPSGPDLAREVTEFAAAVL